MKKAKAFLGVVIVATALVGVIAATGSTAQAATGNTFKVGMEAAYMPYNWTQNDNRNGAVSIDGVTGQYANGYDVQVAKQIAKYLGKDLVVVKTSWDGLLPALTSGRIDAIVAGMSPTAERRQQIDFTDSYYSPNVVVMVQRHGKYADAISLKDFSGAKITAQLGTFHYDIISQIPGVNKQLASRDFSSMRVALLSGAIDGYVAEQPEGLTAEAANSNFKMIEFADGQGFQLDPAEQQVAIGVKKGDPLASQINQWLATFGSSDREKLMNDMIKIQPSVKTVNTWWGQITGIIRDNGGQFLRGAGMTLFISLIGTIAGLLIGLLIGIYRTVPKIKNKLGAILHKIFGWFLSAYIEIFRGTPMIVQAMVLYYGLALAFGISIDRLAAALLIVSINTGAYMAEIVRGGIFAVDKGQFEAAQALGMTHLQTMRKIILPQVLRNILPATGNEFVINIKDTSVLSVIAVSELFFQGTTIAQQNFMYFQTFAVICTIYFVLTFSVTRILRWIEHRMDGSATYTVIRNQMQIKKLGTRV